MSGCASGSRTLALPASFYSCREPAAYPEQPGIADLVAALNDTYLAWEECHAALRRLSPHHSANSLWE